MKQAEDDDMLIKSAHGFIERGGDCCKGCAKSDWKDPCGAHLALIEQLVGRLEKEISNGEL